MTDAMKRAVVSLFALILGLSSPVLGEDAPRLIPVRFEVALQSPSKVPFHGEVKLVPKGEKGAGERTLGVEAGKAAQVALPVGSAWEVSVAAPGFWVRRFEFQVGSAEVSAFPLEAWPLGSVVGRLTSTEKPPALPKKIVVTTLPARSAAKIRNLPKGEIECPVDVQGRFRCELPAATFDLSIFAASYIPRYAWDVAVPAGGETDLKTLALVRGASLAGWVEVAEGAIDPDRCRVSIAPVVAAGGNDLGAIEKQTRMKREAKVNAHGFFQVVGLPAGSYSISAEQGTAFAEPSGSFEVAAQGETYLPEPFRLVPPLELELVVDPALDPHGKSWSVHVERLVDTAAPLTEEVFDGKASEVGIAKVAGQRRGTFSVRISDSTGQRMLSEHDLRIDSEAQARRVFEIHWIALEGSVRLGDEPLQATLWFGGKSGPTAIRFDSDKEGRFSGALSREGHWRIDLAADSPPIALQLQRVIEEEKDKARLDIEVPDTRIFGRVLAPSGRPEPAALVSVLESDGASQILPADDSGHFELRGVAPGEVSLVAETRQGDLDADPVVLSLGKEAEVGPVDLKLQKKTRFAGRVLASRGGAGGAAVTVMGVRPARLGNDRTRTSADGRFEARLPSGVESAVALVAALGSALTAFELRPGPATDLQVADLGGTVEVALGPPIARRIAEEEAFLMLFQNGLEIPPNVLADWSRSHGEPSAGGALLRFPALATGGYSACLVPVSAFLPLARTGWSPDLAVECRSGTLVPGETLRLRLGESS